MHLAPAVFELLFKANMIIENYSLHNVTLQDGFTIYKSENANLSDYYRWKYLVQALSIQGKCGLIQVSVNVPEGINIYQHIGMIKGKRPNIFNPFNIRGKFSPYNNPIQRLEINSLMKSPCEGLTQEDMLGQLSQYSLNESIAHTPDNKFQESMLLNGLHLIQ